ncbi:MAG: hypothetical protein R3E76_12175 [Planctomycetota bacterium]
MNRVIVASLLCLLTSAAIIAQDDSHPGKPITYDEGDPPSQLSFIRCGDLLYGSSAGNLVWLIEKGAARIVKKADGSPVLVQRLGNFAFAVGDALLAQEANSELWYVIRGETVSRLLGPEDKPFEANSNDFSQSSCLLPYLFVGPTLYMLDGDKMIEITPPETPNLSVKSWVFTRSAVLYFYGLSPDKTTGAWFFDKTKAKELKGLKHEPHSIRYSSDSDYIAVADNGSYLFDKGKLKEVSNKLKPENSIEGVFTLGETTLFKVRIDSGSGYDYYKASGKKLVLWKDAKPIGAFGTEWFIHGDRSLVRFEKQYFMVTEDEVKEIDWPEQFSARVVKNAGGTLYVECKGVDMDILMRETTKGFEVIKDAKGADPKLLAWEVDAGGCYVQTYSDLCWYLPNE